MMSFDKRKIITGFLSIWIGLFLWAGTAHSQNTTANEQVDLTIEGKVLAKADSSAIAGAGVRLYNTFDDSSLVETTAGENGSYKLTVSFPKAELNYHYRIEGAADGFTTRKDVVLIKSKRVQQNIALKKADSSQQAISISSIEELQKIGNDPAYPSDGNYVLANDIDASITAEWNNGKGFKPIELFTGNFDGKGHTIRGLTINRPEENGIGLISTSRGASLKNINLEDIKINGNTGVGSLVATNNAFSVIDNCHVEVTISATAYAGGLAAVNNFGLITNSSTTGSAELRSPGKGGIYIGGLIGRNNHGLIHYSTAHANISVQRANQQVGGFVGRNHGKIHNSGATGNVTNEYSYGWFIGGFVGENDIESTIARSYATGDVTGALRVGGFVGYNTRLGLHRDTPVMFSNPIIKQSFATGDVSGDGGMVGGFVGSHQSGVIKNSFARGSVTATGDIDVGGFAGTQGSKIHNVYATGKVSSEKGNTGGLAGEMSGQHSDINAIALKESYWNTQTSQQKNAAIDSEGQPIIDLSVKGLTSEQMTGANARQNMTWFDYESIWQVVEGDYPTLQWTEEETNE